MGVVWMVETGKERLCDAVAKEGMGGIVTVIKHQGHYISCPVMSLLCCNAGETEEK